MSPLSRCPWGVFLLFTGLFSAAPCLSAAQEASGEPIQGPFLYAKRNELTLQDYMQQVVRFNESVQGEILGFHAARRQQAAEMGEFEPAFVASAEWIDRQQPNADIAQRTAGYGQAAIQAALNGEDAPPLDLYPFLFEENNRKYTSGLEVLTPLGTRLRLGATADDIRNNYPPLGESSQANLQTGYVSSVGLTVEQPLLRGLGFASNLASFRLAARQSEIAFQQYRRGLMQVVAEAELAYWELFYAQEEHTLSRDSVRLAQTILEDSEASFESGRGSRLDVLEAEAGLALRRSREQESFRKRVEAMNKLAAFFGGVPRISQVDYLVSEAPVSRPVEMSFEDGVEASLKMNPDLLRARLEMDQERIRLGYAKNQRLPELNLTAGYTANGHGFDWESSFEDIQEHSFPIWNVALVLRVPIWGDVRGRNEVRAARLRLMEAERTESHLITQLKIGRDTAEQRLKSNFTTARSYEAVVDARAYVLESRMQSRDVGRMDTKSVLEAEEYLFESRLEQLQSEIEYQRALLELQLISGNLLQLRGLETSLEDLEYRTTRWIEGGDGEIPGIQYQVAEYTRLPAGEPISFDYDLPGAPWMGVDWGGRDRNPYERAIDTDESKSPIPRRFDGSHIR